MVVSQRELFSSLVHQVENEFRIFTVFICEDVLALENRCVEACATVGSETVFNDRFDTMAEVHLFWTIVARTLHNFQYEGRKL